MSNDTLVNDLKELIARKQVVVVAGAGVAIATVPKAQKSSASWIGLLQNGVTRCQELGVFNERQAQRRQEDINSGDLDELLGAAEIIQTKLGGPQGGEFRRWLEETVGALSVETPDVIRALQALGVDLATTNYDNLIEEVTGLKAVTWRQSARVEQVWRGDKPGVLHLHGHYEDPESVILGLRSYEKILGDAHAQTLQKTLRMTSSFLFVGCGKGLEDTNIGALIEWSKEVFKGSTYRHFLLCLNEDVAGLRQKYPPESRIFPIGFGDEHPELAGFLRSLAPSTRGSPQTPGGGGSGGGTLGVTDGFQRLPAVPHCFGRDVELNQLITHLSEMSLPSALAILGAGGIGKSNLSLKALHAEQIKRRFGKRRVFVRCDAAKDRESLVKELAQATNVELGPNLEERLFQKLETAAVLVVLDNLETPWEHDRTETEAFLNLLTGIETVALVGSLRGSEKPHQVRWDGSIQLEQLPIGPVQELFLKIAGTHFQTDPRLAPLLTLMDGLPLAAELLAHQAEGETDLEQLEKRWKARRTALLACGDKANRLTSLAVSIELSFESRRMSPTAREVLTLLGVLPNGIAHRDLTELFGAEGLEAASSLRKVGLVFETDHRLRVLAPVREYLAEFHPPDEQVLTRAMAHYTVLGAEGKKVGRKGGREAVARLSQDIENVEAMITSALTSDNRQPGYAGALGLGEFFRLTGFGTPKILVAAAQTAGQHQEIWEQADCIQRLGDIALARSDHGEARARYEEARPLYEQVGDVQGQANCIQRLGDIALERSDHGEARARYEEARPLYEQVGSVQGQANCIKSLGDIALARSDHGEARARYEEARPLYEQVGDVLGQANCIQRLGDIALARSDHGEARARYEEARPLYEQVGSVQGQANCIQSLGDIAFKESNYDTARSQFERALTLYKKIPEPYSIGLGHRRLARLFEKGPERNSHVTAARSAWLSIDRPDLVKKLDDEFGSDDPG